MNGGDQHLLVAQSWQVEIPGHVLAKLLDADVVPGPERHPVELRAKSDGAHLDQLVRQLRDPLPPLGRLAAVPTLPNHYRRQPERLRELRDALR